MEETIGRTTNGSLLQEYRTSEPLVENFGPDDADDAVYKVANLMQEKENMHFLSLCMFMGFDYSDISPSIEFDESSFVMRMKGRYGGVGMAASAFIRMYKLDRGAADSTDRFRVRREVRNQFHK